MADNKNRRPERRNTRPRRMIEEVPVQEKEWKPVTALGKLVLSGTITDIAQIFDQDHKILEAEIVNNLLPDLEEDLLMIGQAKGKFGGGQRRIFRQTQKKTREGNKIKFTTCALVGNKNGYVGINTGKSKETVPARDKSKRRARLNLFRIRRGCGSWQCNCREPHSLPFAVSGKCGSSQITLMPAPKGKGLCVDKECAKILAMAGVKDIWSKTTGQTKTKLNLIKALEEALRELSLIKVSSADVQKLGIVEGKMKEEEPEEVIPTAEEITAEAEGKEIGEKEEKEPVTKESPGQEPAEPSPNKPPREEVKEEKQTGKEEPVVEEKKE